MLLTIWAAIYFILYMLVLLPVGIITFLFSFLGQRLRKFMSFVMYKAAQGGALLFFKAISCTVTAAGRENIPKDDGICFVSNHDGLFDIILLIAYCGRPIGFIAKKELSYIPFLNIWIYMIGGHFIDRASPRKANLSINKGVNKLKSGGGMIIFPEAHRSRGRGLLPFHPGALKLATLSQVPIVPVAISGTSNAFEKNYRVTKTSMKVSFCEPIYTADLPPSDRKMILCDKIYSIIKNKLENS